MSVRGERQRNKERKRANIKGRPKCKLFEWKQDLLGTDGALDEL